MVEKNKRYYLINLLLSIFLAVYAIVCLLPIILTFCVSITDESEIARDGYSFIIDKVSFEAYRLIFAEGSSVIRSYINSIVLTLCGTLFAVLITGSTAYTLSNPNIKYRGVLGMFFFIPMVFNAGMVPWYLICSFLHLRNNFWALLVPNLLFNVYNMFLVRNYMSGLPNELRESATLDGANDAQIAFRIYFPLSVPVLATIALFFGLGYWNDWWNAIMLVDNEKLFPIQYLLLRLKSQVSMVKELQMLGAHIPTMRTPSESLKMATAIITIGPIILMYPFLQKYYVKGLVIGSVKG